MHRQLTVLENLEFSAMTRLPATWTLARRGVASLLRWRSRLQNPRGGIRFVRAARRRELGSHGAGSRCGLLGAPSASPPAPRSRRRAARTDGPDKI